jgi:DNA repair exonuclease SbcCD ATPase subunit
MIKKIHLEDFMAHQDTSIELSPGVTVITGPNNVGKSAVVEAIRHLVYNPSPKNIIRHKAKKAMVSLEFDSGEIIIWQRQALNASYTIQKPGQAPEEYHKFGRDVPDDVRKLLCLDQVEIENDKIDIHLGNQRQPIFLLDKPGSHAAGFFAASTEADYLLKMQQLLKVKIDQAKRDERILSLELTDLVEKLSYYEPLDDLGVKISQVEQLYSHILATDRQLPLLDELISNLQEVRYHLLIEKHTFATLGELEDPPVLKDIAVLTQLLAELKDQTGQHRLQTALVSELMNLISPPALATTFELEALSTSYEAILTRQNLTSQQEHVLSGLFMAPDLLETSSLSDLLASLKVQHSQFLMASCITEVLTRTQEPPSLESVDKLPGLIQDLADQLGQISTRQQCQSILLQLLPPPQPLETDFLNDMVAQLGREQTHGDLMQSQTSLLEKLQPPPIPTVLLDLENSLLALHQEIEALSYHQAGLVDLTGQLARKRAEIETYLKDSGVCPLCGNSLGLEHFLESYHA